MEYEIHVTVKVDDESKFISDCKRIRIKPILIETENSDKIFERQIMTSSKYISRSYKNNLKFIVDFFNEEGYEILRKKIEIRPSNKKNKDFIYYESHFRLKFEKGFDKTELKNLCKQYNFHLSKNLFKIVKGFEFQMITYRDYESDFEQFNMTLSKMKDELDLRGINYDKIEIEECIFDSNKKIDNSWLNKKNIIYDRNKQ